MFSRLTKLTKPILNTNLKRFSTCVSNNEKDPCSISLIFGSVFGFSCLVYGGFYVADKVDETKRKNEIIKKENDFNDTIKKFGPITGIKLNELIKNNADVVARKNLENVRKNLENTKEELYKINLERMMYIAASENQKTSIDIKPHYQYSSEEYCDNLKSLFEDYKKHVLETGQLSKDMQINYVNDTSTHFDRRYSNCCYKITW